MIVASSKRVGTSMRKGEVGTGFELKALAQSSLSLYTDRPRGELTLEDFEVTALGRLAGGTHYFCARYYLLKI